MFVQTRDAQQGGHVDRASKPLGDLRVRIGRKAARDERDPTAAREGAEDRHPHALRREQAVHVRADDPAVGAHRAVLDVLAVRPDKLGEGRRTVALGPARVARVAAPAAESGERSSKLLMPRYRITATSIGPARTGPSSESESSGGTGRSSRYGRTPSTGTPLIRRSARTPDANSDRSPRNLFTM